MTGSIALQYEKITKSERELNMKQIILAPIDFSNNALVAARYAIQLAEKMQADVHVFHTFRAFTSAFQTPQANQSDVELASVDAEKNLTEFMAKLSHVAGVTVTSSAVNKSLLDAISDYITENNVGLVVMGAHGTSGTRNDLLGSNTYDIAKDVSRPLLIVPEHIHSFSLKNVVFFSDYQQGDFKTLTDFSELFGDLKPNCTLVHIHEENEGPEGKDQEELQQWQASLIDRTPAKDLSSELVHLPETMEVVNGVLTRLNADMTLITLVDGRNFLKTVLHKSLARTIILNPQTPVLLTSEDTE